MSTTAGSNIAQADAVRSSEATAFPNTTIPLITSVNDPKPVSEYGPLATLVGTWNSNPTNPTGFNVMPLPAGNVQNQRPMSLDDFQFKNFYYFEELTFTAPGEAPNRGQLFQQGCYALTYEQRVYFASPPTGIGGLHAIPTVPASFANKLIHFENGLWLNTDYEAQPVGAYGPPTLPNPPAGQTQPPAYQICKQFSVPHGNSMLATGTIKTFAGPPRIDTSTPDAPPFNSGAGVRNPALVLTAQLAELEKSGITVTQTTEIYVDTKNPGGGTLNMVFEQGNADVTTYNMHLYIEELSNGTTQIQYVQTILFTFDITTNPQDVAIQPPPTNPVTFQHITANTLTKVPL